MGLQAVRSCAEAALSERHKQAGMGGASLKWLDTQVLLDVVGCGGLGWAIMLCRAGLGWAGTARQCGGLGCSECAGC